MPDKETVINRLQIIHTWAEFARERDLQFFTTKHLEDIAQWADDAIVMLKEQDGLMLALEQSNAANEYLNAEVERLTGLLKEQEQIKSPDEFKSLLLGMFDSIWDVEIDHPIFQDTVGELMEGVLQAYRQAVKWE